MHLRVAADQHGTEQIVNGSHDKSGPMREARGLRGFVTLTGFTANLWQSASNHALRLQWFSKRRGAPKSACTCLT